MIQNNPTEKAPRIVRRLLWVAAGLSLLFYAWILLDLVTHPFSPGNNSRFVAPFLFRWLSAATGTFTVMEAVFILRRMPANVIAQLLVLFGVGAAGWSLRTDFGSPSVTSLVQALFGMYFFCVAFPALDALIINFPTGQVFPPRLSGWVWGLLLSGVIAGILSLLGTPSSDPAFPNPVYIPALSPYAVALQAMIVLVLPGLALTSLGRRYRAAAASERLQIKWLLYLAGVGVALTVFLSVFFPAYNGGKPTPLDIETANVVGYIYWQAFPAVAIWIAVLRYRLWDIDLIIRRTLVYGVVSGTLALIYFGGVTLFQWMFTVISGQQSPVSVVISTLLIAALFTPLRRRVQEFIDRRFYRQKYDAARAIASFSASARNQVEFEHLTRQLVNVVEETIQPVGISLWLKKER